MFIDRDDVRGFLRVAGVIAFVISAVFLVMSIDWPGGVRKDRATGIWYDAANRRGQTLYVPLSVGAAVAGVVFFVVAGRGRFWASKPRKKEPIQLPETTRGK